MGVRAALVALVVATSATTDAWAFVPPTHGVPKIVVAQWAGTWATDYGTMHLVRTGDSVSGDYAYGTPPVLVPGHIDARIDGVTLRVKWSEGKGGAGSGQATFILSANGLAFAGTWTTDGAPDSPGTWNGTRAP